VIEDLTVIDRVAKIFKLAADSRAGGKERDAAAPEP